MPNPDSPGLPARAALDATGLHLALADIAREELRDPFLQDTLQRVPAAQTIVHVPKAELGRAPASAAPSGVIFHVARCGSTLLSQLLKLSDEIVVYSEPLAVSEVLVPPHAGARADLVAALRTVGKFFATHARQPYVLKLSSWNTLFCDIVAEAFPLTPWAICIRDPLEVCVSLLQQRPGWLRGDYAARFSAFVDPGGEARVAEQQLARVFAAFCEGASRLDPTRGLLVPYEMLPDAVWNSLAPHFGLRLTDATRHSMAVASRIHSKSQIGRATVFVADDETKRAAATPELRRAVDQIARPAYGRLLERLKHTDGSSNLGTT